MVMRSARVCVSSSSAAPVLRWEITSLKRTCTGVGSADVGEGSVMLGAASSMMGSLLTGTMRTKMYWVVLGPASAWSLPESAAANRSTSVKPMYKLPCMVGLAAKVRVTEAVELKEVGSERRGGVSNVSSTVCPVTGT